MNDQSPQIALQPGYELHWYRVDRVLGQGAFGITYLAHDINLDRQVAIKEYLPGQFAMRGKDMTVSPTSEVHKEDFEWGLKRFISEARTLTKFEHPNLVKVFNVFEMNNTAYMVMNYEVGKSLKQILKSRKSLGESEIKMILLPLMSGLELMHEKGFVHRDIKPGNIFIRGDGSPVLLDFGSARQTRSTSGRDGTEETTTLTTLVSPGYAPIEQYGSRSERQGPWTDIYGLGATLYRTVTGLIPIAAVDRSDAIVHDIQDPYLPITATYKDRYSENFLAAIDHAMGFKAQDRPQSIADWRKEFGIGENVTATNEPAVQMESHEGDTVKVEHAEEKTVKASTVKTTETVPLQNNTDKIATTIKEEPARSSNSRKLFIAATATVLVLIVALVFLGNDQKEPATETMISGIQEPAVGIQESEMEAQEPQMEMPEQEEISTAMEDTTLQEEQRRIEKEEAERRQKKIQELLRLAKEDIDALRLTSPKDNNAFDKYLATLKLDEDNEEAKAGIQAISDKYVALAYGAIGKNKFTHADSYLSKASAITPDSKKIAMAQDALNKKRTEQKTTVKSREEPVETEDTASVETEEEPNESFWDKVKKWHEENLEKSKGIEKDNTIDERVRKTIGGQ